MKNFCSTVLFLTVTLSCGESIQQPAGQEPPPAPSAIELFNGANLEGWDAFLVEDLPMDQVWSVQDGLLVCKGTPMGYLFTRQEFTSFKLIVEWRWAPGTEPGNSGVLLRINGEAKALPRSIEAQLQSGNAGDLYGFHGMQLDGDPSRKMTRQGDLIGDLIGVKKITGAEVEPGEWNRYEITLSGSDVTVLVNGVQVNEAFGAEVLAGPIGLQSEGGEIHFRRVALTPLN